MYNNQNNLGYPLNLNSNNINNNNNNINNNNKNYNNFIQEEINFDQIGGVENIYSSKLDDVQEEIQLRMRLGFIRKVFGILFAQLLLTTLFCLCAILNTSVKLFLINNPSLLYLMLILIIILPFLIICSPNIMRKVPINYLILFLFTFAEAYLVAYICIFSNPMIVFMAACMTCAMVFALTVYAVTTKKDFTLDGGWLFILGMGMLLLILFGFFLPFKLWHVLVSLGCVVLFSFYLIYDIQLIIGNKKEMIQVDDYILGAFCLYTDVIYLFLKILEIFNFLSSN